jgi:hypothetical protein
MRAAFSDVPSRVSGGHANVMGLMNLCSPPHPLVERDDRLAMLFAETDTKNTTRDSPGSTQLSRKGSRRLLT